MADDVPLEVAPKPAEKARTGGRRRWIVVLGTAAGAFLGIVLLVGLYAKALDPEGFAETIERESLDGLLSSGTVAAIGLFVEAFLGLALLLGLRYRWVLLPAVGIVVFFLFLTGRAYYLHAHGLAAEDTTCGCFGNLIQRSPSEAFWQDLFLMVPALVLAFFGRPSPGARHARGRTIAVGAFTAAVLVFAWFAPDLPLDDLATRLHPGADTSLLCAGEAGAALPGEGANGGEPYENPEDPIEPGDPEDPGFEIEDEPLDVEEAEGEVCLDTVVVELAEGVHVVVMVDLEDPRFIEKLDELNEYALAMEGPPLWVLAPATDDEVRMFKARWEPAFELVAAPRPVLRPLYRRLPRSFRSRDGRVTDTWQSWAPLGQLAAEGGEPEPDDEN